MGTYSTNPTYREKQKARARAYYQANKEKCKAHFKKWRSANLDRIHELEKRWRVKQKHKILAKLASYKNAVFDAYGRRCNCCGYADDRFLTIDHIRGDGSSERKGSIYVRIIRLGFPKDRYQILCWNCNLAKRQNPMCPHQLDALVNVP